MAIRDVPDAPPRYFATDSAAITTPRLKGVGNSGQYAIGYAGQFVGEVDVQGY
jgi:hypothetical protein